MIVVKVEVWPEGNVRAAREVGRLEIANVGGDEERANYDASLYAAASTLPLGFPGPGRPTTTLLDDLTERLSGKPAFVHIDSGRVDGFARRDGVWALIRRAIDAVGIVRG